MINTDLLAEIQAATKTQTLTKLITNRQKINSRNAAFGQHKAFIDQSHPPGKPILPAKAKSAPLILHVDDDVDVVDAVTTRLAAFGYRTASAHDGMSGVNEALRQSVNAIILDYDMPNGRGDVVIDLLRANEKTKDTPIIVLTAVEQKNLARQLLNRGANAFMLKQSKLSSLQAILKTLLDGEDDDQ